MAGTFRVTDHLYFDQAGNVVKDMTNINQSWTETGPGGTVNGHAATTVTTTDIVHGDGYDTWVDTYRGLPNKLSAPGFGVVARDAANIALQRTLVFNGPGPEDDQFVSEVIYEHGDHPTLPSSSTYTEDWIPEYCSILAG